MFASSRNFRRLRLAVTCDQCIRFVSSGHRCQGFRWNSPCDHDACKGVPELVWRWHGALANGAFGDVPSSLGNIRQGPTLGGCAHGDVVADGDDDYQTMIVEEDGGDNGYYSHDNHDEVIRRAEADVGEGP